MNHQEETGMRKLCSVIIVAALILSIAACNTFTPETSGIISDTAVSSDPAISTSGSDTVESTGDSTSDTTHGKETLSDIGENYFKDVSPDDVETDKDTGIVYVKNQLLISCEIGTPKEEIEKICKEIDAEIVGYIEITSDFQIEFNKDHTYAELLEEGKALENQYEFIRMASINPAYGISYD
jgi:hypothetical protein